jgi:hypothetical protein
MIFFDRIPRSRRRHVVSWRRASVSILFPAAITEAVAVDTHG